MTVEVRDFKTAAKAVAEYLNRDGVEVSQSRILEALSRGFGGRNWVSFRESLASFSIPESTQNPVDELLAIVGQLLDAMTAQEKRDSGLLELDEWRAARDAGQRWLNLVSKSAGEAEPVWLTQVNTRESETDMRAIAVTIESLASDLKTGLDNVDFKRVSRVSPSPQHLVAVLRTSFAFRHRVKGWFDLRDFAMDYLVAQGFDAARVMKGLDCAKSEKDDLCSTARPMVIPKIHTEQELAKVMPDLKHLLRQMMYPLTPVDRIPPWEYAMLEEALTWTWHHYGEKAELKHVQDYLATHPDARAKDMAFQLNPWVRREPLRWLDGIPDSYLSHYGLEGPEGRRLAERMLEREDDARGSSRRTQVLGTLTVQSDDVQREAQATLNLDTGEVSVLWNPGSNGLPTQAGAGEQFKLQDGAGNAVPFPVITGKYGDRCVSKEGCRYARYLLRHSSL